MDEDWALITSSFYLLKGLFQNLCENNFQEFKMFFCSFIPKCPDNTNFNSRKQTLVFNYYVHLECYANYTRIWTVNDRRLVLSDRQECFEIYNRLFEGLTEFISGPCIYAQQLIYTYRIDIWMAYISRVIDDIDSGYYLLKFNCLKYIRSFIEGVETKKNKKIVAFMGSNIHPQVLFNLMIELLKKLYVREHL